MPSRCAPALLASAQLHATLDEAPTRCWRAVQIVEWDPTVLWRVRRTDRRVRARPVALTVVSDPMYPRLAPAMIVSVERGDEIPLARSPHFQGIMSVLAGFVEPGESAEDAVKREVYEETDPREQRAVLLEPGLAFPNSSCLAEAGEAGDIEIDGEEIVAAQWFNAREMPNFFPARVSGVGVRTGDGRDRSTRREIVDEHGPRSVALYPGTYSGPHPASIPSGVGWMIGLGSKMVFTSAAIDQPGKHVANAIHGRWLGGSHVFDESDVWLLVGNNPLISMSGGIPPSNPGRRLREAKARGIKLIVIDPRKAEVAASRTSISSRRPARIRRCSPRCST